MHLRLDLSTVPGSPLPGQVCQRAMARSLELTVRHDDSLECCREVVVMRVGGWDGSRTKEEVVSCSSRKSS